MVYNYSLAKSGDIAAANRSDGPSRRDLRAARIGGHTHAPNPHQRRADFALKLSPGEYVHFKSKDGTNRLRLSLQPLDYTRGKKVPTLLHPHGGPVWAWYAEFQATIQVSCGQRIRSAVAESPGSSGYGQKYCQAIFADWGNKDYQDDVAMVDYAIEQGIADPDDARRRWAIPTARFSTDFIIAQTTRFKGAIL